MNITDDKDSGLTATVSYTKDGSSVAGLDTSVSGTYVIHYNVSDNTGNPAVEVTRTVIVDAAAPVITLRGGTSVTVTVYSDYVDDGATASDDIDGSVKVTDDSATAVDTTKIGTYVVTYTAKDFVGNTSTAKRTVNITNKLYNAGQSYSGRTQISRVTNNLAGGAKEYTIVSQDDNTKWQNTSYICQINTTGDSNLKIMSSYGLYNASKWQMTTLTKQAAAAQAYFDKTPGYEDYKVVGILNADFFNMSTGEPQGALVLNGVKYHNAGNEPYFAILKDGTPVIRDSSVPLNDCESAVGGYQILLKNGVIKSGLDTMIYSRTAIGIKADGTVVTLVTRGFRIPDSYGLSEYEQAAYLKAMGCVDALMLDGGGSSEWTSMYEGTDVLRVRNNPSDGYERNVSSALLIVSTAARDGEFDHATVTPTTTVYTPYSTVTFSAAGVDSAGGTAALPQGTTWAMADSSFGTINASGAFTSNGKTGNVTVLLRYDNSVVGSSTITIAAPDSISFVSPEVNIGRGKVSDLGMLVLYQGRSVVYKEGDLIWTLSNPSMGTVDTHTNTMTASPNLTLIGTVTITSKYDENVNGTVSVKVGQDPTVVMDFEDKANTDGTVTDAYAYWGADSNGIITGRQTGTTFLSQPTGQLTTLFYNRGGKESAEIVSRADGYPVHLGSNSLKLNYDMRGVSAGATEGANVGLTQNYMIPGSPTAIGLWVYVPENTPNLWLRVRLSTVDANGSVLGTTQYDFTPECKMAFANKGTYGGLSDIEQGSWQFLTADLSKYAGTRFMIPAGESIRIMYKLDTSSSYLTSQYNSRKDVKNSYGIYLSDGTTLTQADCVGSIYVDDFMFIYGSINEDAKAPTVTSFTANTGSLTDGMTFDTDTINFKAIFSDDHDDVNNVDASGIDFNNVFIYIDGQRMQNAVVDRGGVIRLDGVMLANGEHTVRLLVCDQNGNEKNLIYRFTVNCLNSTAVTVHMVPRQQDAVLGKAVDLDIISSDLSKINAITATIRIDIRFQKSYTIVAGDGYTIDQNSIVYDNIHNTITFTANRSSDATSTGNGIIATVSFAIPTSLTSGTYFVYSVDGGSIVYADGYSDGYQPSFASLSCKLPVTSLYTVSSDVIVVGMTGTSFYVKDKNGEAVAGVTVYNTDGSVIGTTDDDGKVSIPSSISSAVSTFTVYAEDSQGNISFSYSAQSYSAGGAADGSPVHILNNAAPDGSTARNLSWLSNPVFSLPVAAVQISSTEASILSGEIYNGTSRLMAFTGSVDAVGNYATRINGVTVSGLTPGATYYYRVGDGVTWSPVGSFTMPNINDTTNMFVLGDIQANDLTNIQTILDTLQQNGVSYDLGIQTGDAVDLASSYTDWTQALGLMDNITDQVMLHTVGNHEETGESGEDITSSIYNLQNQSYYSVRYGLVYVATISYMPSMSDYETALKWLVDDASKSDAPYKILVIHQPAFYTNASEPSNAQLHDLLPAYAQQAGIDIVFSGHDHSYARTEVINGVVYYICGTSGEKAYPVTINDDFHFVQATDDFTAIYITLRATNDTLTVTTYDLQGGVPTIIDTYTKSAG